MFDVDDMSLFSLLIISWAEFGLLSRPLLSFCRGEWGNLLVPFMAAIGLGSPPMQFELFRDFEGGIIRDVFDSDLLVKFDFVFGFRDESFPRGKEFLLRLKVDVLLSTLMSSLFSDLAGLFSFFSVLEAFFTCSFLVCACRSLDCLALALVSLALFVAATAIAGGFI